MIGVSLPFDWLCGADHPLGNVHEVLTALKARDVGSVELRAVRSAADPLAVLRAATLLWDHGFDLTVHASAESERSAVTDVFAPLSALFSDLRQENVTVTLHPVVGDNVAMLRALAEYADRHGYPVTFALENNRLLPDRTEGDSAALVLAIVEEVARPNVGICFDMGHYMYYLRKNRPQDCLELPGKKFFRHVVHTHIHALKEGKTHFPLDGYDLPLEAMSEALCHEYFGVYNIELDFPRFAEEREPLPALLGSVETLRAAMPHCARLYDEIRARFDERFLHALTLFESREKGTRFALVSSSAYLFNTSGFRWAMDLAFRNAYRLAKTPARIAELLADLELMIISHGHGDHFEKRTVQLLAKNDMKWVIPDFLVGEAISLGIPPQNILTARLGEPLQVGPLTICPFPGRHFRPTTGKGTEEYGYYITAPDAPSLAFPVDVRDFSLEGLPDLPPADVCFANIWLGDKNGLAEDYSAQSETFARFMLRFSDKTILTTHLYENGRKDADMWRVEHAAVIADAIRAISPETRTIIPRPGEIIDLS